MCKFPGTWVELERQVLLSDSGPLQGWFTMRHHRHSLQAQSLTVTLPRTTGPRKSGASGRVSVRCLLYPASSACLLQLWRVYLVRKTLSS